MGLDVNGVGLDVNEVGLDVTLESWRAREPARPERCVGSGTLGAYALTGRRAGAPMGESGLAMSKGSRRKRATRPWQDPRARRDIESLLQQDKTDQELFLHGYEVRRVAAERATKDYRCPDCGNLVPSGEAHVVVWPTGEEELRRHWHTHCWRLEVRRSRPSSS